MPRRTLSQSHRFLTAVVATTIAAIALPAPLAAYHFFTVASGASKLPVAWRNLPVTFIVDKNPVTFQTTVQNAFNVWNNVATAKQIFGTITLSTDDLTSANYQTVGGWGFLTGDGKQEVVCDSTGTALANLGLSATSTLGYGPRRSELVGGQGAITDAFFILNCSIAENANFNYLGTMVHELGHDIGLAHSSAYLADAERLRPLAIANAPTMYPYSIPNNDAASATLEADDIAGISELYPDTTFAATYATLSGTVTRCGGTDPVNGVNVRAVSVATLNTQVTRYTGFNGNTTGFYEMKVPVAGGPYNVIIEVMSLPVNAMAMNTAVDKDFATEYRSNATEEADCTEPIPDTPTSVAATSPDERGEGDEFILGSATANVDFKVNPVELAFVIDDTGSMGNEIGAVKQVLTNEINALKAVTTKPFPNTAIISFKDNVTIRTISRDPVVLQATVNTIFAGGGSDCPEWSNDALLTAGRLLRNGGKAMLFTDADSHPSGPTAAAVSSLYTSKSLRMSVLLSGTCSGELDGRALNRALAQSASGMNPAKSQNPPEPGDQPAPLDKLPAEPKLGVETSIVTNAQIAAATGGLFAAIPGIKDEPSTGGPETTRYVNTGTNIAVSASLPTVGLINPGDGPRGATLDVEITGSNTNFQGSSQLSFSGGGITVVSRSIRSATSLSARITVAPDALPLGFRDVTVTTVLGPGTTETAVGVGSFNVKAALTEPTVVSASPSVGFRGQTLNVTIRGVLTNFTSASKVLFCDFSCFSLGSADPKIVVNSVAAADATTLVANITIAADAEIAYRNVAVFTGSEEATEEVTGPFLIAPPAVVIPILSSATPEFGVPGQANLIVTLAGQNTNFVNGTSVASFSGTGIVVNSTTVTSPTTATADITILPGTSLGFRDIIVTTGGETAALLNGFNVTDTPTAQPVLGLYAASIVGNQVTLRWSNPASGLVPTAFILEGGVTPGQVLASIPTGSTLPIFTFTAPSGAFYVRLHTIAGASRSLASNEIRIFVNQPVAPSAPSNLLATVNGNALGLAWRNTFAGGTPASMILDASGTVTASLPLPLGESASFSAVPAGTYTLRLRAANASGTSGQSNAVTITVPSACTGAPQPPAEFLAYKIGNTIYVMWEPAISGGAPTSYQLVVTGAINLTLPTTQKSLFGAVPAGTYNLSVRGINACGSGDTTTVTTIVIP